MNLFKRQYTIRSFGEQRIDRGYASSPYQDRVAQLDVQPLSADELATLPEGQRTTKRLKAFGDYPLKASNQNAGTVGDRLFYQGIWYECVSSLHWNHTLLSHYRSEFVQISEAEPAINIAPPTTDESVTIVSSKRSRTRK